MLPFKVYVQGKTKQNMATANQIKLHKHLKAAYTAAAFSGIT